jgi:hypothetical protein
MERDWTPGLCRRLAIAPGDLPLLWDADFLRGDRDGYVLCEINTSCVSPMPEEAPAAVARTLANRLSDFLPAPTT